MIGFFEESEGVRSMTRLVLFITVLAAVGVVAATCVYVLIVKDPQAPVIAALAGVLATLIANGVVAIIKRNGGADAA